MAVRIVRLQRFRRSQPMRATPTPLALNRMLNHFQHARQVQGPQAIPPRNLMALTCHPTVVRWRRSACMMATKAAATTALLTTVWAQVPRASSVGRMKNRNQSRTPDVARTPASLLQTGHVTHHASVYHLESRPLNTCFSFKIRVWVCHATITARIPNAAVIPLQKVSFIGATSS
eukprot:328149-Pleurochrysis_carterae.AAC.1